MARKHPIQNVVLDKHGVKRFQQNKIVDWMVDQIPGGLNTLRIMVAEGEFEDADYEQLMQLIGYSLSGFGDLCMNEDSPCMYQTLAAAERKKIAP